MTTATTTVNGNGRKKLEEVDDIVNVGLIGVYLVQKLGQPTLSEIIDVAEDKLFCKLGKHILKRALAGASRKNFVAILQSPVGAGGHVTDVYSMKDMLRFKSPPEYAHIGDLLPNLLSTPQAQEIKAFFDGQEGNKGNESKTARGNVVDEYHDFWAICRFLDPIYGSQIHCPYTDAVRKQWSINQPTVQVESGKAGKKKTEEVPEMAGIFVIDALDGSYIIPPDVIQGWFRTNAMRYAGAPDARTEYVAFQPIRIFPQKPVIQTVLPVNSQRGVSAPKSHETIQAGQFFEMKFSGPTKGLFAPAQYEKLLHRAATYPRRGLSPARGKRTGRFQVLGFKDLGAVRTNSSLDFILEGIPPEMMKKYGKKPSAPLPTELTEEHVKYLVDATERLKNVELRGNFSGSVESSGAPFPSPGEEGETEDD